MTDNQNTDDNERVIGPTEARVIDRFDNDRARTRDPCARSAIQYLAQ